MSGGKSDECTSRMRRSSDESVDRVGDVGLGIEALLPKNEKRLAIGGFDTGWVEARLCFCDVRLTVDEAIMLPRGSAFSFVGDTGMPSVMGSDSPVNHSASLPPLFSLNDVLRSPVSMASRGRFEREGEG